MSEDAKTREIHLGNEDFEQIEQKLRTVNPILFCNAFLQVKIVDISGWKLLRRVWKKSKGNAVALVLMSPFALFKTRKWEETLSEYTKTFVESNKKLEENLPKAEKESEKMFLTSFIELNTIAIEMNPLLLETTRKLDEANKLKGIFTQNPTTENLLRLWNVIKDMIVSDNQLFKLERKKADTQDRILEYDRKMTKFDRRDIQDFWRAILADLAFSIMEKRALVVNTPIEILLKSGGMMKRIKKALFISEALREGANQREESDGRLMNWFVSYQEKRLSQAER
jgi:hypothetical protein